MGNVFGSKKPLKEIVRDNQRLVNKATRELEREINNLERSKKKLEADIKKMAKQGQMSTVRVMAKDLVRTKNHINKFIEMKTHLTAVGLKLQTVKSNEAMASAMKGVTKALKVMNKQIQLPELQKLMAEFERENERADITQEAIGDTLDDAFAEDTTAEEEDKIVKQVLDELGVGMGDAVPEAPETAPQAAVSTGGESTRQRSALCIDMSFVLQPRLELKMRK